MTQPAPVGKQRQHPRYPFHRAVALRVAQCATFHDERALDIGVGGMFIATDTPQPPLTEGTLSLLDPGGGARLLPVRVMRVVTPELARVSGGCPGMGLEFGPLTVQQRALVTRLVDEARSSDVRRRIPRQTATAHSTASVDPMLSYVLDFVDGVRGPEELAQELGLQPESLIKMLRALWQQGLVEFTGASTVHPVAPRGQCSLAPELAAAGDRDNRARPTNRCDLSDGERRAIERKYPCVDEDDHYAVLDISPVASLREVGAAFTALNETFHPEAFAGRALGGYGDKLLAISERVRSAYVVLGDRAARAEYDRYRQPVPTAPAPTALSRPGPTSEQRRQHAQRLQASLKRSGMALKAIEPAQATPAVDHPVVHRPRSQRTMLAGTGGPVDTGVAADAVDTMARDRQASLSALCLDDAQRFVDAADFAAAAQSLELVRCMGEEDSDCRRRYDALYAVVVEQMAEVFERKAKYDERQQRWSQAARNWLRVCDARGDDAHCHRHAADTLGKSGDTRRAYAYALKAVELDRSCANNHEVLGNALLALGLGLRARRALEEAARLRRGTAGAWRALGKTLVGVR